MGSTPLGGTRVISCAFCGRDNDEASRFCIDCGKPIAPSIARAGSASSPQPAGSPPPQPSQSQVYNVVVGSAAARPTVFSENLAAGASSAAQAASPPPAPLPPPTPSASLADAPPAVPMAAPRPRPADSAATPKPRSVRCPRCTKKVDPALPFCGYCGTRVVPAGAGTCPQCGANHLQGVDLFCARCGNRVGQRVSVEMGSALRASSQSGDATPAFPSATPAIPAGAAGAAAASAGTQALLSTRKVLQPRLALLDENGGVARAYILDRGEAVLGRGDADIRFESDHYMSPLHARIEMRGGQLWLRDLGSRNGTWIFVEKPVRLTDGDLVLVGSQVLRFRRLGYPGPHPPEADSTRRMGSLVPTADVAVLEQLRADGSVRDMLHLSPGRSVLLGRETGDWIFPYDQTMSGKHAEVRSEDVEFYIHDAGSRNGVAMAVRGERQLHRGQRLLLGDQIMRVERA